MSYDGKNLRQPASVGQSSTRELVNRKADCESLRVGSLGVDGETLLFLVSLQMLLFCRARTLYNTCLSWSNSLGKQNTYW